VLSCGHTSLTLYIQLYLGGFGLELSDIKSYRFWGSKTPGHPEYAHTDGVEVTTGPLGQGVANAVGMAMSARRLRGLLDPNAAPGTSVFDHHIYCLASDGDIEEGVSSEASSLAATQRLSNLTLIYDSNRISIEDDTNIALTEDTPARYAAYGWHVQTVDWTHGDAHHYRENVAALAEALEVAKTITDRPSFICLKTIIGWPAPKKQNTGKIERYRWLPPLAFACGRQPLPPHPIRGGFWTQNKNSSPKRQTISIHPAPSSPRSKADSSICEEWEESIRLIAIVCSPRAAPYPFVSTPCGSLTVTLPLVERIWL